MVVELVVVIVVVVVVVVVEKIYNSFIDRKYCYFLTRQYIFYLTVLICKVLINTLKLMISKVYFDVITYNYLL